jgi:hypothetical protein
MRVLLVGSPAERARLRARLAGQSTEIAGEFPTLAIARSPRSLPMRSSWPPAGPTTTRWREPITPRELEVLELLTEGLPNKAIARQTRDQRSDGEVSRVVDLRQARRGQPYRRCSPRHQARVGDDLEIWKPI